MLENITDPARPNAGAAMNFLTEGRLALFRDDPVHPDHEDGTLPYLYNDALRSEPVMQFLGSIDESTRNGSEQIYLPASGSTWRASTHVAIWDPNHPNLETQGAQGRHFSTGEAAVLVFGRGYGEEESGLVVYQGGHRHDNRGSETAQIASQRIVLNLLLQATLERGIIVQMDHPALGVSIGQAHRFEIAQISGGVPPYEVSWASSCGGSFDTSNPQSVTWTPPNAQLGERCMITAEVVDACNNGRIGFKSVVVLVEPPRSGPSITRSNGEVETRLEHPEGQREVTVIEATDPENDPITFALANGEDRPLFTIDPNSGALRFIVPPDFENPTDANMDNVYHVEVVASDQDGADQQLIIITVTDIDEPVDVDSDNDGLFDHIEEQLGTDPQNPDSDGDGISDGVEVGFDDVYNEGVDTDPLDADSDDDGISDGAEAGFDGQRNQPWETDPLDADTDDDGLQDGTELGVTEPVPDPDGDGPRSGTDPDSFIPDADPTTRTDPLNPDTDEGSVPDGEEDTNLNGRIDAGETNPSDASDDGSSGEGPADRDSDGDGLSDTDEIRIGTDPDNPDTDGDRISDGAEVGADGQYDEDRDTDPLDADTDDDGLSDGFEADVDEQQPPSRDTDPLNPDTDGDGLLDGTELGVTEPIPDPDGDGPLSGTDPDRFIPDADPNTHTDARNPDSDGGGIPDGAEDKDRNGRVDPDETDPNDASDDRVIPSVDQGVDDRPDGDLSLLPDGEMNAGEEGQINDQDRGGNQGGDERERDVAISVQGGGCTAEGRAPNTLSIILLALFFSMVRRRERRGSLILFIALMCVPLIAFGDGFEAQNLRPSTDQELDYLHSQSARPIYGTRLSLGLFSHYADDALVVTNSQGQRLGSLIGGQFTGHLLGSFAFYERFRVSFDLPMVLHQTGDQNIPVIGGLGDHDLGAGVTRLILQTLIFSEASVKSSQGASLAFALDLGLPTGDQEMLQGDGWRVEPRFLFDYVFTSGYALAVNVGYEFRNSVRLINLEVDDTLNLSLASHIPLTATLALVPELISRISVASNTFDTKELPIEGLAGLKYVLNSLWLLNVGGGLGLGNGYNAPDWRLFLGLSTALTRDHDRDCDGVKDTVDQCIDQPEDRDQFQDSDGCPDSDNDQDHILDRVDRCPLKPEDIDGFQDHDGCPDLDNDQDGILDAVDQCPLRPEDLDRFNDQDGCPDPDNDQDGLADTQDKCPLMPEDLDRFQDQDGCPDPDNDQDRILDVADRCPIDPENYNGFEDTDGCPDRQLVTVSCEKIDFQGKIYFATAKAIIQKRSYPLLNEIAKTLQAHPEIKLIRIEGHTDHQGSDEYNFRLSDARAASVLGFLAQRGVSRRRLLSKGFGESKPIASNRTRAGRAENRRVELVILERSGCQSSQSRMK